MTTKYLDINIMIDNLYKMKNVIFESIKDNTYDPSVLKTNNFINTYYQTEKQIKEWRNNIKRSILSKEYRQYKTAKNKIRSLDMSATLNEMNHYCELKFIQRNVDLINIIRDNLSLA
jgi:hypothetical protein